MKLSGSNDSDSENSSNNEDWKDEKQEENQSTVDYKPVDSILAEDFEIERRSSMGMSDLDNREVEDKSSVSLLEGRKVRTSSRAEKGQSQVSREGELM